MAKSKLSKDPLKVIETKLNALVPNGNFKEFAKAIKTRRSVDQKTFNDTVGSFISPTNTIHTDRSGSTAASDRIVLFSPNLIAASIPSELKETNTSISPIPLVDSIDDIRPIQNMGGVNALEISDPFADYNQPPVTLDSDVENGAQQKPNKVFKVAHFSPRKVEPLENMPTLQMVDSPRQKTLPPLKNSSKTTFSCKADKKSYLDEKQKTLDLVKSFDSQLSVVEKVYRKAKKQTKRTLKELKMEESGLVNHTQSEAELSPSLTAIQRHTSAQILIKKQSSVDGLMQVTYYFAIDILIFLKYPSISDWC
jgi:hypothetical protein